MQILSSAILAHSVYFTVELNRYRGKTLRTQ